MRKSVLVALLCLLASTFSVGNAQANIGNASLRDEAYSLMKEWIDTLLTYQYHGADDALDGGLLCPACARIHGRIGDAVLPLMYLADRTGERKYLTAAKDLMKWMDNVHLPDGSWVNDVNVSGWKGTTVFSAIALYEALHYHGDLLDDSTRTCWTHQLERAGDYIKNNPQTYSLRNGGVKNNVNYPASATYALYAIGKMFGREDFVEEARQNAKEIKNYFTPENHLVYGEGPIKTDNKCQPIDLSYNVEETLPNLACYAVMAGDEELLELVEKSMCSHLQFMLPDGAWDNSWGTRSFKWTYWGGRTSDGMACGFYLLADKHPEFIEAIRRNLHLLKSATYNGLLCGGMNYIDAGMRPCIHHTFCHAKALTFMLELPALENEGEAGAAIPRDEEYGARYFQDNNTWLVSKGGWRATVTGYDAEYSTLGVHPMGGALSVLWNRSAGPIFAATMNEYSLIEAPNMQAPKRKFIMSGTPRLEMRGNGRLYNNLNDRHPEIACRDGREIKFNVKAYLEDINHSRPDSSASAVRIEYVFSDDAVSIIARNIPGSYYLMLPIISAPSEAYVLKEDGRIFSVGKQDCEVIAECEGGIFKIDETDEDGRIFNPVPGFTFIPLRCIPARDGEDLSVEIRVK